MIGRFAEARGSAASCRRAHCAARPARRALLVHSLHKALRQPNAAPLSAPEDVVYECLTLLRRPDLASLAAFLPAGSTEAAAAPAHLLVGGEEVVERGPLACCHRFMDTAARRVLPGHLLRRCRVLSSMQLADTCQQRVALTACTGEEAVFVWRLRRAGTRPAERPRADSPLSAGPVRGGSGVLLGTAAAIGSGRGGGGGNVGVGNGDGTAAGSGRGGGSADVGVGIGDDTTAEARIQPAGADASSSLGSSGASSAGGSSSSDARRTNGGDGGPSNGRSGTSYAADSAGTRSGSSHTPADAAASTAPPASQHASPSAAAAATSAASPSPTAHLASGPEAGPGTAPHGAPAAWVVESVRRDDSYDDDELPTPGPLGGGPHPRCPPELVVKAQLAALRRGDMGGWDLHLSAFRALMRQPAYQCLLAAEGAELRASAMPSPRRLLQEVLLLGRPAAGAPSEPAYTALLCYQLGMQANGCWVVEAIRLVA